MGGGTQECSEHVLLPARALALHQVRALRENFDLLVGGCLVCVGSDVEAADHPVAICAFVVGLLAARTFVRRCGWFGCRSILPPSIPGFSVAREAAAVC